MYPPRSPFFSSFCPFAPCLSASSFFTPFLVFCHSLLLLSLVGHSTPPGKDVHSAQRGDAGLGGCTARGPGTPRRPTVPSSLTPVAHTAVGRKATVPSLRWSRPSLTHRLALSGARITFALIPSLATSNTPAAVASQWLTAPPLARCGQHHGHNVRSCPGGCGVTEAGGSLVGRRHGSGCSIVRCVGCATDDKHSTVEVVTANSLLLIPPPHPPPSHAHFALNEAQSHTKAHTGI